MKIKAKTNIKPNSNCKIIISQTLTTQTHVIPIIIPSSPLNNNINDFLSIFLGFILNFLFKYFTSNGVKSFLSFLLFLIRFLFIKYTKNLPTKNIKNATVNKIKFSIANHHFLTKKRQIIPKDELVVVPPYFFLYCL